MTASGRPSPPSDSTGTVLPLQWLTAGAPAPRTPAPVVRPPLATTVGAWVLFVLAYYLAYRTGMSFSRATVSPFWFPDSVLLCALLVCPPRKWAHLVLLTLPILWFSPSSAGIPPALLLTTFVIDAGKGIATAAVLRRYLKEPTRFDTARDFLIFALTAILLVPAIAAFVGATVRLLLGEDFSTAWREWYLSYALTQLVVTPILLYWGLGARNSGPKREFRERVEAGLFAVGLVVTSWAAFETATGAPGLTNPRLFLPIPLLFWLALRFGMAGATGGAAIVTAFCLDAAFGGNGPFAGVEPTEMARTVQQFLAILFLPLLLVAALIQQMHNVLQELRESEARFRRMADSAPVLIWSTEPGGALSFANQVWRDFTGATKEQSRGESLLSWVHPDDRSILTSRFEVGSGKFTAECRLRREDGEYRWMLCTGVPRRANDGSFLGFMGSCVDITAQREADLQMQRHRAELAHVSRVATLGELTASIAHELRQPLGAILNNAEAASILLEAESPALAEIAEILRDIRADDERAGEILSRMRTLLEKHEIARQPVELAPLVRETFRLVHFEATERRVRLRLDAALPSATVLGDHVHLQQVLLNLILNGFDSMACVPEERRTLRVRLESAGERSVRLKVEDSGSGIAAEQIPHLFEPFATSKPHGLGMGLSISRTIVEAHEGRISGTNRPEGGATFELTLPLAPPIDPASGERRLSST